MIEFSIEILILITKMIPIYRQQCITHCENELVILTLIWLQKFQSSKLYTSEV